LVAQTATESSENFCSERGASALPVLIVVVALAIAAFLAYRWWTGEERIVKKRLDALAVTLSPPANGELAMIARIVQLRGFFAPDVHIQFSGEIIDSRDALVAVLGRWQPPKNGFTLTFADVVVHMVDADTAHVSLTAEISNSNGTNSDPLLDAREGTLTMTKVDGEWVIATAETANTLQR
jgi:hypothetical protein